MTIQNTAIRKAGPSQGNGVNAAFPFTFKVFLTSEVLVTYLNASSVESTLIMGVDYTIGLNSDQNASPGGSVTMLWTPATGTYVTLTSQVPNTQNLALTNSGGFYPSSINDALDRVVIQVQQLAERLSRSLKLSVSSKIINSTLPEIVPSKFLRANLSGTGFDWVDGTGTAAGTFLQSGVGAVARSLQSKLGDIVSVKDFGATGNGITDDTEAIILAIAFCSASGSALYIPYGVYRSTKPLYITLEILIIGDAPALTGVSKKAIGTWFYFDHAGIGISISQTRSGSFKNIGTLRNQPTPSATTNVAWTPAANDFDFSVSGCTDITFDSVILLNATKGIHQHSAGGRINFFNIKMQVFDVGIQIDEAYDVVRFDNIHIWPFCYENENVHTYTANNLIGIQLGRCDNPHLSSIFTIFAHNGLKIVQNVHGGTSKIHATNCDFDAGFVGIYVDETVTNGTTGSFSNITSQGKDNLSGSIGLLVKGVNCILSFDYYNSAVSSNNSVRIQGNGNRILFGAVVATGYDQAGLGFPAFEAYDGNTISYATIPTVSASTALVYSLTGTHRVDQWRPFSPVVTSQTGTITALGNVTGKYKVIGDTVHVLYDLHINTIGTAGGGIKINLPYGLPLVGSNGCGREVAVTGKSHSISILQATTSANLINYDNSFPAVNGCNLVGKFEYNSFTGV